MAEMELLIKPIFASESVDNFANKVEDKLGGGGAGGKGEGKKQTVLLENIARFTKMAAIGGTAIAAIGLAPLAAELGKKLGGDTKRGRLEAAFDGGENYNEEVADAIANGEELTDVLTKEMVAQEGLDQIKREATETLAGHTARAEDARKTLDDLKEAYIDLGGTVEEFNDQVGSLAAADWVNGDATTEEIKAVEEAVGDLGVKIEETAAKSAEDLAGIDVQTQKTADYLDGTLRGVIDQTESQLNDLPNAFDAVPFVSKIQTVIDAFQKLDDMIDKVRENASQVGTGNGFGGGGGGGRLIGDGVR
jgi:hypothetical protein